VVCLLHWVLFQSNPAHFIGIKTPWTLENKEVWKLIHIIKLWLLAAINCIEA
jgi:uncharacterized membrane protein